VVGLLEGKQEWDGKKVITLDVQVFFFITLEPRVE